MTADTITPEQIRELRDQLTDEDWNNAKGARTRARIAVCNSALVAITDTMLPVAVEGVLRARAKCAEMINARVEASPC